MVANLPELLKGVGSYHRLSSTSPATAQHCGSGLCDNTVFWLQGVALKY